MHGLTQAVHFVAQAAPGGGNVPVDPGPVAPPGVAAKVTSIIGWVHWGAYAAGIIALLLAGMTMMVGKRNRSSMAADGASHLSWIIAGLVVVSIASVLVGALIG